MISMNPNLASAGISAQTQQNGATIKAENKVSEPTESQRVAQSGNSSVSLSDASVDNAVDYSELAQNQTVRSSDSTENRSTEANQTQNGLSYASSLELQANYAAKQAEEERADKPANEA
ncbi:hypothetical protein [Thiomicrorhabdus sediminis]|uniref:Uncharacterized protein n=1 Tax=Thiomicrorhabdus sediminis TaxID=2580412 RepID=A0A4P9K4S0_9GAMM|nr:hypothetical protein [Thiomicrorhabdus sediminis]QCU89207.1 hypothetical protein FE785_00475 [Thiomicrorhabdus sediminis]